MKTKKLVLAYSGGLDTSYCAKFLNKQGFKVHAVCINTGGFTEAEIKRLSEKTQLLGIKNFVCINATETYYQKIIKYLVYGNVLKNNTYPLSVSAERIVQAIELINYAKKIGAGYIAHGSTGAGNDQVRFDMVFQILAPKIDIITPIRDAKLSRQEEIAYLKSNGISLDWNKAKYSINQGLWGTSVGGAETLTSHLSLPEEAYPSPLEKEGSEQVDLQFEKGEIVSINNQKMTPVEAIQTLQKLASPYAIGRDIHVGDTIIGIKGRVGFEAAAPIILIKSHQLLEKHVLSKWQQHWKEQLGNWYGMLLHEGQYLDPVMRNIEKFLEDTQQNVSGTVSVTLHPYRFELIGIESAFDLMNNKVGQYGEINLGWTGEDTRGFTKILANPTKIHQSVNSLQND